jgi:hypothetical protein
MIDLIPCTLSPFRSTKTPASTALGKRYKRRRSPGFHLRSDWVASWTGQTRQRILESWQLEEEKNELVSRGETENTWTWPSRA